MDDRRMIDLQKSSNHRRIMAQGQLEEEEGDFATVHRTGTLLKNLVILIKYWPISESVEDIQSFDEAWTLYKSKQKILFICQWTYKSRDTKTFKIRDFNRIHGFNNNCYISSEAVKPIKVGRCFNDPEKKNITPLMNAGGDLYMNKKKNTRIFVEGWSEVEELSDVKEKYLKVYENYRGNEVNEWLKTITYLSSLASNSRDRLEKILLDSANAMNNSQNNQIGYILSIIDIRPILYNSKMLINNIHIVFELISRG